MGIDVAFMALAWMPSSVLDCPEPAVLVTFYGTMLDWTVEVDDDWADFRAAYGQCISFQHVQNYTPPVWPEQDVPQQMHIDVMVTDLDEAETAVMRLGARRADHQPGETLRVFLDPAGHPFCVCTE